MRVWKQILEVVNRQRFKVPMGAKALSVQVQNGVPCLWYLCDENFDLKEVCIDIYGTGHTIPETGPGDYIDTFQLVSLGLVFHVFAPFGF